MSALTIALALVAGAGLGFACGLVLGLRLQRGPATASPPSAEYRALPDPMREEAERFRQEQAAAVHEAAIDAVLDTAEAQAAGMTREQASAWLRTARATVTGRSVGGGLVDWTSV